MKEKRNVPCVTIGVGVTIVGAAVEETGGDDESTDADDCWITDVWIGGLGDGGYNAFGDGPALLNFGRLVILCKSYKFSL